MKIQIISDLHREFGASDLQFANAEVVVLAGDVNLGTKGIDWIKTEIPHVPVVYVLGNHEYYKGAYPKTLTKIQDAARGSNVFVLEDQMVEIGDIRFHGTTLWTDFSIFGNPMEYGMYCQDKMSDYRLIRRNPSYSRLRSVDTFKMHQISRNWLTESLENSVGYKNIVVTHHAPSLKSIPDEFKNDPVTAAYASDLEELILQFQPAFWIHGHVHTPVRYFIGQTEIICNPHGYIDEAYNGYDKELIVNL